MFPKIAKQTANGLHS